MSCWSIVSSLMGIKKGGHQQTLKSESEDTGLIEQDFDGLKHARKLEW